jgi:hypothetical protein
VESALVETVDKHFHALPMACTTFKLAGSFSLWFSVRYSEFQLPEFRVGILPTMFIQQMVRLSASAGRLP